MNGDVGGNGDSGTYEPDSGIQPADPDRACLHEDFNAVVSVNRITGSDDEAKVIGYNADIRVECAQCGEPFRWTGVPAGLTPTHPTCSVDETELRVPLRPASADPDFGIGLPGFSVRYREGG